ncbi:helix-turn-helix domain-containing protein [Enterococcus faecalis]|uniref:helix-turn-helix domain-containing protein n=1 Tax=Enterococcus faecalis TaxID=1351 RepID=UPI0022DFD7A0|nr:helix-turn-helix domain-containing protein [Enterococcus faecalis]
MAKYTEWLTDEGLIKIEGWARDGLIDKQIAQNIGVAYSTFREWVKKFPALSASLKRGKEVVDRQVENALFKSAIGYEYTERTAKVVNRDKDIIDAERREYEQRYKMDHPEADLQEIKDAAIKAIPTTERIISLEVDKQVAPNPTSAIFWLKNRKPDEWRDRRETEVSGSLNISDAAVEIEQFFEDDST